VLKSDFEYKGAPQMNCGAPFRLSKNCRTKQKRSDLAGELEGAAARLESDRMPRKALPCKAFGEQSEDFCAACGTKVTAFFQPVKTVRRTVLTG